MKSLVQLLPIIFLVLLTQNCSQFNERVPAQTNDDLLESAFTFLSTQTEEENSYPGDIKTELEDKIKYKSHFNPKLEFASRKSLGTGVAYKVELDIDQKSGQLIYRIYHAPKALKDGASTQSLKNFLYSLIDNKNIETIFAPFEAYHNAKAGDPIALEIFYKYRLKDSAATLNDTPQLLQLDGHKKNVKTLESQKDKVEALVKTLKAKRAKETTKRKIGLDALDKAGEDKQFRTLIAKGDREGAAKLLKRYLPWEEMAPFEKQFWETYLEVLVKPVPLDQRVLIYRGLNEDFIHSAIIKGKEVGKKEAITEGKSFVMSSVMVKNQGSWNRRLRSLEAMNEKYIATAGGSDEYAQAARISVMFSKHSIDPKGSPFLSFSPDFEVAAGFGDQRVSSYLVDPRLLIFNYASTFDNEIEYLIPLSTFPDEMVGIADNSLEDFTDNYADRLKNLEKKLEILIVKEFGQAKSSAVIKKIKKNSYHFFRGEFPNMEDVKVASPGPSNLAFYKKFLTKDDPKPVLSSKGELGCKDLIQLFWVAD